MYTNAQNWRGEALIAHLCTLLRSLGPQKKPTGILVEHVFKPEDLVVVEAPSQMVTINGAGATADVPLRNNFSALALGKHVPVFSDCSVRSVR